MTDRRLTTEDLASGRDHHPEHADRDFTDQSFTEREPVEQTPADRDVAEPDLTDQERLDREPVAAERFDQDQDGPDRFDQPTGQEHHPEQHHDRDPVALGTEQDDTGHRPVDHGHAELHPDRQSVGQDGVGEDNVGHQEPVGPAPVATTAADAPLFAGNDAAEYQAEWRALQGDFVDDPRDAVQRADELVAEVMQSLATTFAEHKRSLEEQWQRGDEVQTEELRQALKRYRSFFDRLLSV